MNIKEKFKNIDTNLYKLTQENLIEYIKNILIKKNIDFEEFNGNLYSLRFKNRPAFIAHLDTVDDKSMSKELLYDKNKNTFSRRNGILGADDRTGVNLILNHIEDINFIFSKDEEIGCLGISDLVDKTSLIQDLKDKKISCVLELDRMGNSDILGDFHGYCSKDLQNVLSEILPNHKDVVGVYTDIDYLCDVIPCANLSVGYYNQHTVNEYLNLDDYEYINSKILELSKISGTYELGVLGSAGGGFMKKYGSYFKDCGYGSYNEYSKSAKSLAHCSLCGNDYGVMHIDTLKKYLCEDCIYELSTELDDVIKKLF